MTADANPPSTPKQTAFVRIIRYGGSLVGVAGGLYSGLNFLIPAICGGAIAFLLRKTGIVKSNLAIGAAALQGGHVVWMLLGAFFAQQGIGFIAEVALYFVMVVLLIWREAKWVIILLMAYQVFGLIVNGISFVTVPIGSVASRALVVHLMLRLGAFICMALLLREKPRESFVDAF